MQTNTMRRGYLVYLGFYFLPPLLQPTALWQWAILSLALGAFLFIYQKLDQANPQQRWWWLAGLWAIASGVTPLNSGSMAMFAYISFFLGFWLNSGRFVAALVVLLLWQAAVLWLWHPMPWLQAYAVIVALGVSVSGIVERIRLQHQQEQQRSDAELQLMARQLERERIARDLHDLLGHSLASIALKAELADVWLAQQQPQAARQQLAELQQLARHSLLQVRQTISGYRQQGLDVLLPELLALLRSNGWTCVVDADLTRLAAQSPPELELCLTELCTNLLKHSNGHELVLQARLQSGNDGDYWQLQLQDNGQCSDLVPGGGLTGIRQRLQALGGSFSWQLAPTRFVLRWPCQQSLTITEHAA
ncbi:MAG: histidine kinase [Rheinheimera sp.]|nr:histidine kinase [Rheinheimera sp.]